MAKKIMDLAVQNVLIKDACEFNAEVYVLSLCLDDRVTSAEDIAHRGNLLQGLVEENINDDDELTIGPGGLPCYSARGEQVPNRLAWAIAVYESDAGVRDFGKALEKVSADARFVKVVAAAAPLLGAGAPAAVLAGLAAEIMGLVGLVLQLNQDDQLFLVQDYYDRDLHQEGPWTTRVVLRENEYVRLQYKLVDVDQP